MLECRGSPGCLASLTRTTGTGETVMRKRNTLLSLATMLCVAGTSASGQQAAHPRTPWGDPDIQGTYTNTYENGTPLERPEQFAGRKLSDITGEELRATRRQIQ